MAITTSATFGALLRHHRLSAGLTQEALAKLAGVSVRGVQRLERDQTAPRAETVRLLADALGLSAEAHAELIAAAHPDLAAPPPSTVVRPRRAALPVPPTALVGREREVAAACTLLRHADRAAGTRLLTLTGPGGVGKTRLALAVAEELAADFADGVVWIELAPLQDAALVPGALARALGVDERGERSPRDLLKTALAERQLLLILDNCEHLPSAMPLIAELLAACPRLAALATSRARLRLRGERELPVAPLAVPAAEGTRAPLAGLAGVAAVRLFLERAQAVRPGFALTADNAAAVTEICRQLEGLPLAIELAAVRLKLLPPAALLARLERRLPLLAGGARDAPERQHTMRAAIAWSYDLLTPAERALFRRLAVFAGGHTLEAAEFVGGAGFASGGGATLRGRRPYGPQGVQGAGDAGALASLLHPLNEVTPPEGFSPAPPERSGSPTVFDLLASLADQSLLRAVNGPAGEPRTAMFETIREFALERLIESGEEDAARAAHATHYLALAEAAEAGLNEAQQAAWLDRLEVDHDNLRAALSWALARGDAELGLRLTAAPRAFWRIRGHIREGRAWHERALALPAAGSVQPAVRARALAGLGDLLTVMGNYTEAEARLGESLELQRAMHDSRAIAATLQGLALVAQHQNAYDRSGALYKQSLPLARQHGDDRAIVTALNGLAIAAQVHGDRERATGLYEESLAVARRLGAPRFIAVALGNLGNLAADQGDAGRAVALFEESLARYREIGDQRGVAICLYSLGHQAVVRADERAGALLAEALEIFDALGDASAVAETLDVLARTNAERGAVVTAARLLAAAAALRARSRIPAPTDPHYRADYDRAVTLVRAALGPEPLSTIEQTIQAQSSEQVIVEALAAVRLSHPPPAMISETPASLPGATARPVGKRSGQEHG